MNGEVPARGAASFADVVETHWAAVYRFLHAMTGHSHDTEDLTQETFLRAFHRFAAFQPGTNLRAWLLRIASNAYFDLGRKRRRGCVGPLDQEVPGREPPPETRLEIAEQAERIQAGLAELSELTRLVFHLRVTEDLSFREIAVLTGTTEQAARWHMHQARTRLLKRLETRE